MNRSYFNCTLFVILFIVPASAFQGSIVIEGNKELGKNISITCKWSERRDVDIRQIQIKSQSTGSRYYYSFEQHGIVNEGSEYHSRIFVLKKLPGSPSIRISDLQCFDDHKYTCTFIYADMRGIVSTYSSTTGLVLKARGKPPLIRIAVQGIPSLLNRTWVYEDSSINVTCRANMGRPGLGRIVWKIYHHFVSETVGRDDPRILKMVEVSNQKYETRDDMCTRRVEQTLMMEVSSKDKFLTFACFVQNDNYTETTTNEYCSIPSESLCSMSDTLWILHPDQKLLTYLRSSGKPEQVIHISSTIIISGFAGAICGLIIGIAVTYAWSKKQYVEQPNTRVSIEKPEASKENLENRLEE